MVIRTQILCIQVGNNIMKDIKNHATLTDNLVSWWHLGDGGGVRYDQHGSNNLTDRNSVGYEKGLHGNCAVFDKDNSENLNLPLPVGNDLFVAGKDVSVSLFFRPEDVEVRNNIFWARNRTNGYRIFTVRYEGNLASGSRKMIIQVDNGFGTKVEYDSDTVDLVADKWYFIAVTYDVSASSVKFLVKDLVGNTVISSTDTKDTVHSFSPSLGSNSHLALGSAVSATDAVYVEYMSGEMQSAGVWSDKVLSNSEIDDLYNYGVPLLYDASLDFDTHTSLKSSLVFWNNLNSRLDIYNDSSDNNHDLVLLPAVGNTVHNTLPARKGSYLTLDGSQNGYLKELLGAGESTRITDSGDFSLAAMVKIDALEDTAGEYALFSTRHSTDSGGFSLNIVRNTGALKLYYGTDSSDTVNTLTTSTYLASLLGEDVFIGVSVDVSSRTIKVHINGRERTDIVLGSGVTNMNGHHGLVVGQPYVNTIGDALNGNISKIGYWDKIVTEDEFKDIYNMGAAIWYKVPTTIKPHNSLYKELEAYWEFEEDTGNDRVASTGLFRRRLKDESSSDVLKVTGKIRQGAVRGENTATKRTAFKLEHNPLDESPNNFLSSPLSIVHWYKPRAITNSQNSQTDTFIHQWGGTHASRNIRYRLDRSNSNNDEIEFYYQNMPANTYQLRSINLGTKLSIDEWYQFALIFDGVNQELSFRLNASLIGTVDLAYTDMNANTSTIYIFKNNSVSRYSSCDIDGLAIYRKVLAEGDLFEMFNSGAGIHYRSNPTTTSQLYAPSVEFNTGENTPEKRANHEVNQNIHSPLVLGVPNQYDPNYDLIQSISQTPSLGVDPNMAHATESFYRTRAGRPPSLALTTYTAVPYSQQWKSKEIDDTANEWETKPLSLIHI